MSKTALFIKHKAKPGKREEVRKVWKSICGRGSARTSRTKPTSTATTTMIPT
jgi:hypothetical protein